MTFKHAPVIYHIHGETMITLESLEKIYVELNVKGWGKQAQGIGRVLESVHSAMEGEGWKR